MGFKALFGLTVVPAAILGGSLLACVSRRVRDVFFVMLVFLSPMIERVDVNFVSREWYRGTSRGFEFSILDILSISLLVSAVLFPPRGASRGYWPASLGLMMLFFLYACGNVAPYDKLSRASLLEAAARFRVLSTGWFELRRLPCSWWPKFAVKKMRQADHWRMGGTWLLSHPGCLLSRHRPRHEILEAIIHCVDTRPLTVLVTHWWEYFREGRPEEPLIEALHETADYLGHQHDVKTIYFDGLAQGAFRW
jgi:hypothetical protein